jgi:ABC-type antimicrobial peptide transport system permease subunit
MVVARAALLLAVGIAVGVVGSVVSRRLLATFIPMEVSRDAIAIASLALGLSVVGMIASLLPARRAASIEPMQALRNE